MVGAIFFTDTDHGGHDYFYKGEDANDLITKINGVIESFDEEEEISLLENQ